MRVPYEYVRGFNLTQAAQRVRKASIGPIDATQGYARAVSRIDSPGGWRTDVLHIHHASATT
jgi:hypothetical protein